MREEKAAIADGKGSFRLETYTLEEPAGDDAVVLNWATPCYILFQCQEGNQHIIFVRSTLP